MPQLGGERIQAMFAEFGLATDEARSRYIELARVGIVDIPGEDDCRIAFVSDSPTSDPAAVKDAELP